VQLGPAEILVVVVIALLVFGPKRLPEVGRQVGRAMKELRKFQHTISRDVHEVFSDGEPHDVGRAAEPPPTLPPKDSPGDASPSADASEQVPPGEKADGA